jgi:hypothetical protein
MTQVPTQPRSPSEHYQHAERLLGAVEETPESAPLLALVHALLCAAPRRARKAPPPPGRHTGGSPQSRWLFGDDQDETSS